MHRFGDAGARPRASPLSLLGASGAFASAGWSKAAGAAGIFGAFLAVQSQRVKFKFDSQSLEVLLGGEEPEEMVSSGENVVAVHFDLRV